MDLVDGVAEEDGTAVAGVPDARRTKILRPLRRTAIASCLGARAGLLVGGGEHDDGHVQLG